MEAFLDDVARDEKLLDQLMQVRQGTVNARKNTVKDLTQADPMQLMCAITPMLKEPQIPEQELTRLLKLSARALGSHPPLSLTNELNEVAPVLLRVLKPHILAEVHSHIHSSPIHDLVHALLRAIGLKAFISCLRPNFKASGEQERNANAVYLVLAAQFTGIALALPLIKALAADPHINTQLLALFVIHRLPFAFTKRSVLPFLTPLVSLCSELLAVPDLIPAANTALVVLADLVEPHGFESFKHALDALWLGARTSRYGKLAYLRALAAVAATAKISKEPASAGEISESVFTTLEKEIPHLPHTARRVCVNVLGRCGPHITNSESESRFIEILLTRFWQPELYRSVNALVKLPASRSKVLHDLVKFNAFSVPELAVDAISKLLPAQIAIDQRTEQLLAENVLDAVGVADMHLTAKALGGLAMSLPTKYASLWLGKLISKSSDPNPEVRAAVFKSLAAVSPSLTAELQEKLYNKLVEELGEEYPNVLAEVLGGLRVLKPLDAASLVPRLTPILRNRNETVQEQCIQLVKTVAEKAGEQVAAREWIQCCFELLEMQKSQRQTIRHEATSAFASISQAVGPASVVETLVGHLHSPDRQFRVTTAAAIASVASETGAFAIVPILLREYQIGDIVMQHGVLKALAFMAQFVDKQDLRPLVTSLVTVMDNALLDSNQVHRQTAATIVSYMANSCVGRGRERIFVHLLNELMPSIFETSPHVIDRVMDATSAICHLIGGAAFSNYLWAGLFHPARKVRNVYWRMWQNMMVKEGDSIVPIAPTTVSCPINEHMDIRDVWI